MLAALLDALCARRNIAPDGTDIFSHTANSVAGTEAAEEGNTEKDGENFAHRRGHANQIFGVLSSLTKWI